MAEAPSMHAATIAPRTPFTASPAIPSGSALKEPAASIPTDGQRFHHCQRDHVTSTYTVAASDVGQPVVLTLGTRDAGMVSSTASS